MASDSMDTLYRKVAKKVLSETLRLRKGEAVTVEAWNNGLGFARVAVAEARAMGCTAVMLLEDEQAYVEGVQRSPKDSLGTMGKNEYNLLSGTDGYVFVPGPAIAAYSKALTPAQLSDSTRYNSSWYDAAEKAGLRGARLTFGYVGRDMARMLGKSVDDIVRGQLRAALTDFAEISKRTNAVAALLSDGSEAALSAGGAKLSFSLKGDMEVEDGVVGEKDLEGGNNMSYIPPGLISKQLDPGSATGMAKVSKSLTKYGVLSGAELEFKDGQLVSWKSKDKAMMDRLLSPVPEDKRRLTLLVVGANPAMKYGMGQDRFVDGLVTLGGLGFNANVRSADLSVGGSRVIGQGRLRV